MKKLTIIKLIQKRKNSIPLKIIFLSQLILIVGIFFCSKKILAVQIDDLSLTTTPIYLINDKNEAKMGTGFFCFIKDSKNKNSLYLVTNYHVLAGHRPLEKKPFFGEKIRFFIHLSKEKLPKVKQITIPLFSKNKKAIWISSSKFPEADVAVIPLPAFIWQNTNVKAVGGKLLDSLREVTPASFIHILGYPENIFDKKNFLPIWKTGHIATEPRIDLNGKPLFLIDASIFKGMSGSPVFGSSFGVVESKKKNVGVLGQNRQFLGVFSAFHYFENAVTLKGTDIKNEKNYVVKSSMELGYVWKARVLSEIINDIDLIKYQKQFIENWIKRDVQIINN